MTTELQSRTILFPAAAWVFLGLVAGCGVEGPHELSESEGEESVGEAAQAQSVSQAVTSGCSTSSVKGLSLQIIAQGNCIAPGAFSKLPAVSNLTLGNAVFPYLEEPARAALLSALKKKSGTTMSVNSMLRTLPQQYLLWRWDQANMCGIGIAATPGNSNHETGLAMDINGYSTWKTTLESVGFKWYGPGDTVHFDYVGAGAKDYRGLDVKAFQQLWNMNHPGDTIAEDGDWGPATEARLKKSPAEGFAKGADCSADAGVDLRLAARFGTATDSLKDGASKARVDVYQGEAHQAQFEVFNRGSAKAGAITVRVSIPRAHFAASDYLIETNWPDKGETFVTNDESALDGNPEHGAPLGDTIELRLGPLSGGETKRVTLELEALRYSVDAEPGPEVRFWVFDAPDVYHQAEFGGSAENVKNAQTFNGGKLETLVATDVYSAARFEWDTDRLEGWSAEGAAAEADPATKALTFTADGSSEDPVLLGPSKPFPASVGDVELSARRAGGAGSARLYFTTDASPDFTEDNSVAFEIPESSDSVEIKVPVSAAPGYAGTIKRLRLDPFESGAGSVVLDYLRAGKVQEPPAPTSSGAGATGAGGGDPGEGGGGAGEDGPGSFDNGCTCRQGAPTTPGEGTTSGAGLWAAWLAGVAIVGRSRREAPRSAVNRRSHRR